MAQIRLEGARRVVAGVMHDACWIEQADTESLRFLDPATGQLIDTNPETLIYQGPCFITPGQFRVIDEGGRERVLKSYNVKIPWDASVPSRGDVVVPTASKYDSELVGRRLTIDEVSLTSVLVWRALVAWEIR